MIDLTALTRQLRLEAIPVRGFPLPSQDGTLRLNSYLHGNRHQQGCMVGGHPLHWLPAALATGFFVAH